MFVTSPATTSFPIVSSPATTCQYAGSAHLGAAALSPVSVTGPGSKLRSCPVTATQRGRCRRSSRQRCFHSHPWSTPEGTSGRSLQHRYRASARLTGTERRRLPLDRIGAQGSDFDFYGYYTGPGDRIFVDVRPGLEPHGFRDRGQVLSPARDRDVEPHRGHGRDLRRNGSASPEGPVRHAEPARAESRSTFRGSARRELGDRRLRGRERS